MPQPLLHPVNRHTYTGAKTQLSLKGAVFIWASTAADINTDRGTAVKELHTVYFFSTTSLFRAPTFFRSSSGSSIGVSAMKAACASLGSFNNLRNGVRPIVPLPMC